MLRCHEFNITVRKAKREDMVQVYKLIKVSGYKLEALVSDNKCDDCFDPIIKFI